MTAPRLDQGGELRRPREIKHAKRLEQYMERKIRQLQSQPLLLLLVAIYFMGGMMKQVKKSMPELGRPGTVIPLPSPCFHLLRLDNSSPAPLNTESARPLSLSVPRDRHPSLTWCADARVTRQQESYRRPPGSSLG